MKLPWMSRNERQPSSGGAIHLPLDVCIAVTTVVASILLACVHPVLTGLVAFLAPALLYAFYRASTIALRPPPSRSPTPPLDSAAVSPKPSVAVPDVGLSRSDSNQSLEASGRWDTLGPLTRITQVRRRVIRQSSAASGLGGRRVFFVAIETLVWIAAVFLNVPIMSTREVYIYECFLVNGMFLLSQFYMFNTRRRMQRHISQLRRHSHASSSSSASASGGSSGTWNWPPGSASKWAAANGGGGGAPLANGATSPNGHLPVPYSNGFHSPPTRTRPLPRTALSSLCAYPYGYLELARDSECVKRRVVHWTLDPRPSLSRLRNTRSPFPFPLRALCSPPLPSPLLQ